MRIEGWRNIKVQKSPQGPHIEYGEAESDWGDNPYYDHHDDLDGSAGCAACGWEGHESDLVYDAPPRLGWDGQPLRRISDDQLRIDVI